MNTEPEWKRTSLWWLVRHLPVLTGWMLLCGFSGRTRHPESTPGVPSETWVSMQQVKAELSLIDAGAADAQIVLKNGDRFLTFYPGSRRFILDDTTVWLHAPPVYHQGRWGLNRTDVALVLHPLMTPRQATPTPLRVLLDPGHGGRDGGAISPDGKLIEKYLTLEIGLTAADLLSRQGMHVGLTRADDSFVSLAERSAIAQDWQADVFVSIHINAADNPQARGAETFVLPAHGFPPTHEPVVNTLPEAIANTNQLGTAFRNSLLGYAVHSRQPLRRLRTADRGLRRAHYRVLTQAPCPAVLVECGFLTNPLDAEKLGRQVFRNTIALGIAEGILDYARCIPKHAP